MGFAGMSITPAVKFLLIANVAVFLLQNFIRPLTGWGVFHTGDAIFGLQIWRFVSYMFLHGDFSHLLFNMFGLWMFGSQIEAMWGKRSFLVFYFICGLGGAGLYALFDLIGWGDGAPMLGASGAIYGILLAYGMTFPNNIILIGFIFPMKAKYAVMLFGLVELMATTSGSGGGVAHLAHLGGMLAGFIFMITTIPSVGRQVAGGTGDIGSWWRRFQTKRKIRVVPPKQNKSNGGSQGQASPPPSGEQKRIDDILDKISRNGLSSLSDEEQEILRRAGRR